MTAPAHPTLPTLTVLLCVHRLHGWLAEAVASVLAQDDPNFEFIVVANACGDDLVQELQRLCGQDPRVRLLRTGIGQLAYNLNHGADAARGEYLVRMDADDVCEPGRVRLLRQALAGRDVDLLGSAVTLIDEHGTPVGAVDYPLSHADILGAMPLRTVLCHPAVAIRRDLLLRLGGYGGGLASEDLDLWLRARRHGAVFRNVPDRLLRYRVHAGQSTAGRLGYAEAAGYWLRELLIAPSLFTLRGLLGSCTKRLVAPWLQHRRRTRWRAESSKAGRQP
jgi:glycosyltransferase involved in cell wall biosynthesis